MTTYTDVFSSSNIYTSELSYSDLSLTGNVSLYWPLEAPEGETLAAKIMDVTSDGAYYITLPSATEASNGETILFNNLSSYTITIKNYDGTQVASVSSGTKWQLYLANNTTQAGVWRAYQFGAGTSSADAAQLAGNGLMASGLQLQQSFNTIDFTGSFTLVSTDNAKFFNWVGTGSGKTVTLPNAVSVGSGWFIKIRNSGDSTIAINCYSTQHVNGASTLTLNPLDSTFIASDGTGFYTVGLGKEISYAFDYAVIDVTGSSDYTLSGNELNRVGYRFTGTLGSNISIIVPSTVQQYWIINATTGSDLYIKTASQITALKLDLNNIYYCDGSNVYPAVTASTTVTYVSGGSF